jgi:hypothetical protein
MEEEFGGIRERYGVDAPDYGKPLEPHHQRILDRFVKISGCCAGNRP